MKLDPKKFDDIRSNDKKPMNKEHHVGVELECYGPFQEDIIIFKMLEAGLEKKVSVGEDGSIDPDNDYNNEMFSYEIRVIDTEKNIEKTIKKVCKILTDLGCKVNESCGLHVHLDMRKRDPKKAYTKLVDSYPSLAKKVAKHRLDNEYCEKNKSRKFEGEMVKDEWGYGDQKYLHKDGKYSAINPLSYEYHKTLEVRMHEGCLKEKKINAWIKNLIKIIS